MTVQENLHQVEKKIEAACKKSGRSRDGITIIAVTKYVSLERMKEALASGIKHLGENKAQDALPKWQVIQDQATWHFIGHLQSNKVKEVLDKFDYIHSLDRLSLAKEIQRRAEQLNKKVSCFVQVNVAEEETKHGLKIEQTESFIEQLKAFPNIQVLGLMTMAPYEEEIEKTRPVFRALKELQLHLQKRGFDYAPLTELSMGMSNDYTVAVEEGATHIRLGSCLVGNKM